MDDYGVVTMFLSLTTIAFFIFSENLGLNFYTLSIVIIVGHVLFWTLQNLWNRSDTRLLNLVQEQGKELRSLIPTTLALELSPKINEMTVDTLKTLFAERIYLRKCVKESHRNRNEVKRRPHLYTEDTDTRLEELGNKLSERLKNVEMQIAAYQSVLGGMTADLYDAKIAGSTPEEMQKHFDGFITRLEEEAERMKIAEAEVQAIHR